MGDRTGLSPPCSADWADSIPPPSRLPCPDLDFPHEAAQTGTTVGSTDYLVSPCFCPQPYFRWNFSTRPAVSTNLTLPVKNG